MATDPSEPPSDAPPPSRNPYATGPLADPDTNVPGAPLGRPAAVPARPDGVPTPNPGSEEPPAWPAAPVPYNPYGPPPGAPGYGAAAGPPTEAAAADAGFPAVPGPRRRGPFPSVGWFLLLTLIGFALNAVVSALGALLAGLVAGARTGAVSADLLGGLPPAALFGILLAASLSWPVVAVVSAQLAQVLSRRTFRLRWPGGLSALGALLLGAALVAPALALEHLSAQLVPRGDNLLLRVLSEGASPLALTLLGTTLVLSAPLGEELLFRGLALRGLERRYGFWPAAILVSAVFASVHLNLTGFLSLALVSLVLCLLTSRTDSLLPAVLAHASYNGAQFGMLVLSRPDRAAIQKALDSQELGIPVPVVLLATGLAAALTFGVVRLARRPAPTAP